MGRIKVRGICVCDDRHEVNGHRNDGSLVALWTCPVHGNVFEDRQSAMTLTTCQRDVLSILSRERKKGHSRDTDMISKLTNRTVISVERAIASLQALNLIEPAGAPTWRSQVAQDVRAVLAEWTEDEGDSGWNLDDLAKAIAECIPSPEPAGVPWKCKAQRTGVGANDPQDCDWPTCGCDPYADKVLNALAESGYTLVPDPALAGAPSEAFTKDDLNRLRQWHNAVDDLDPNYLEQPDTDLNMKVTKQLALLQQRGKE